MTEHARAILEHVPALKGKSLILTKLAGGLTNVIFKVASQPNIEHVFQPLLPLFYQ